MASLPERSMETLMWMCIVPRRCRSWNRYGTVYLFQGFMSFCFFFFRFRSQTHWLMFCQIFTQANRIDWLDFQVIKYEVIFHRLKTLTPLCSVFPNPVVSHPSSLTTTGSEELNTFCMNTGDSFKQIRLLHSWTCWSANVQYEPQAIINRNILMSYHVAQAEQAGVYLRSAVWCLTKTVVCVWP